MSPVTGIVSGEILFSVHNGNFQPGYRDEKWWCNYSGMKFTEHVGQELLQNFLFLLVLQTSKLSYRYLYY